MEEKTKKTVPTWLEVWQSNYNGESEIASWVETKVKKTYKDMKYIPWAVMYHALFVLDPNAHIEKCMNDKGGFVFTDRETLTNNTVEQKADKHTSMFTETTVYNHMVKVKVVFMGKEFVEIYPIQEKDYSSSKVYDQNKVNKALQRAMARCISMATGVAFSLYESGDFIEDDDVAPSTPQRTEVGDVKVVASAKAVAKKAEPKTEEVVESTEKSQFDVLVDFLTEHHDNAKVLAIVDKFNTVLKTKYTYNGAPLEITLAKDIEDGSLKDKISNIANPLTMLNGLRKVV